MNELELKLACWLASYEMDEPHVNLPDLVVGEENKQYYPEISPEKFQEWLVTEHHGDCIKLPSPCIRCYAEMVAHKAKWIYEKMRTMWEENSQGTLRSDS